MLTAKEKAIVDSKKCIIEIPDGFLKTGCFHVFMSLTYGELLVLKNALEAHRTPIGQDLSRYINVSIFLSYVNNLIEKAKEV